MFLTVDEEGVPELVAEAPYLDFCLWPTIVKIEIIGGNIVVKKLSIENEFVAMEITERNK